MLLPADPKVRRLELFHVYDLEDGPHSLEFKWLNPRGDCVLNVTDYVRYVSCR
jgi:hypothetical protein